jgi:hypothetical protein
MQNTEAQQPGSSAAPSGSPLPEKCIGLGGRPLRKIPKGRLLVSGLHVANMHGQFLWEVVGCAAGGVQLMDGIHGGTSNYTWEAFHGNFYERDLEQEKSTEAANAESSGGK